MLNLSGYSRVLVSSHDAGGANQLLHLIERNDDKFDYLLTGPARLIGETLGIENFLEYEEIQLNKYDLVIVSSNSSIQKSDLILSQAKSSGIDTLGILDHWVNYQSRWKVAPDRIVTTDWRSFIKGLQIFKFKVRYFKSEYLENFKSDYLKVSNQATKILVLLQPISNLYSHVNKNCICVDIPRIIETLEPWEIVLREHHYARATDCLKYLQSTYRSLSFSLSGNNTPLMDDFVNARAVVGYDSYAMFISKKLRINTYTLQFANREPLMPKYNLL